MGKAVTFDLTHIKDLEEINDTDMDEAEKNRVSKLMDTLYCLYWLYKEIMQIENKLSGEITSDS